MSDLPDVTDDMREEAFHDLGFGSVLADESQERLLNRDGSFNIRRRGLVRGPYHALLVMTWPQFIGLLAAAYVVTNVLFGAGYLLAGPDSIRSGTRGSRTFYNVRQTEDRCPSTFTGCMGWNGWSPPGRRYRRRAGVGAVYLLERYCILKEGR